MLWINLLFAFLFALLLAGILGWGIGWRHPARTEPAGPSILFLFLVLLFGMWAASAWVRPWGPVAFGTPWLSLLLFGVLIALLVLAVAAPRPGPRSPSEARAAAEDKAAIGMVFSIFFWMLLVALLVVGLSRALL